MAGGIVCRHFWKTLLQTRSGYQTKYILQNSISSTFQPDGHSDAVGVNAHIFNFIPTHEATCLILEILAVFNAQFSHFSARSIIT